jgi:hypothetical protein
LQLPFLRLEDKAYSRRFLISVILAIVRESDCQTQPALQIVAHDDFETRRKLHWLELPTADDLACRSLSFLASDIV